MKRYGRVVACLLAAMTSGSAFAQEQDLRTGMRIGNGMLRIRPVTPTIFRVTYAADAASLDRPSFAVVPQGGAPESIAGRANDSPFVTMGRATALGVGDLGISASVSGGRVMFRHDGRTILEEIAGGRTLEPAEVQGEKTYHVRQQWVAGAEESFYGLGQHQYGLVDLKSYDLELWQRNTEIAVPMLVSSKGYGILWDNASFTKFGDPRPFVAIPAERVADASGGAGGFTRTSFSDAAMTRQTAQRVEATINNGGTGPGTPGFTPARGGGGGGGGGRGRGGPVEQAVRWEGTITAEHGGAYKFQLYSNGGIKLWIDDKLVNDHWRQNWLPSEDLVSVRFEADSKHKVKVEWVKDGGSYCTLLWKAPEKSTPAGEATGTSLWSQVGESVDYYFIYGGEGAGAIDRVIAGYRQLTGQAPMMPIWAFGLWQSRQRYETQQASIEVVKGFRERGIAFDNIVQDWMYWKQDAWGTHQFDTARFPDPDQWIKDLHAMNARVMISVWPKFYPTTDNYQQLKDAGFMLPVNPSERDWVSPGYPYAFYDPYSPAAREMFWNQMKERLFSKGVDAWWMDATEPDLNQPSPATLDRLLGDMPRTAAGTGARVANAYPLLNSQAVYEGQRKAAPDQRVFILTRSGYAGQQRYAAASWSGDITSTWQAMGRQVAAGVGFSISGLPYWTMDSGGFSVPGRFSSRNPSAEAVEEWRELNTRWFQFCTFVPLLRVHGEFPLREMWQFGGEESAAYKAQYLFNRLRYRMLPYVYSLAGDVTQRQGTIMRPLVMDFPTDAIARSLNDQYLFGPAFLVSPIVEYKARSRSVYLPAGRWYDFWTGRAHTGGQRIDADAPYERMPLHVRAGSIVPFGPDLQYTTQKQADPLTVFVYGGADGAFTLYEDDGLTFGYEKGAFSRIPMRWNEAGRTLTIGRREGSFEGMLRERTIRVVFMSPERGVGFSFDPAVDKTVRYAGELVEIRP